jgi:hypothetical protein
LIIYLGSFVNSLLLKIGTECIQEGLTRAFEWHDNKFERELILITCRRTKRNLSGIIQFIVSQCDSKVFF